MADLADITAEPRAVSTKGATRAMRRNGRVPGILYGGAEGSVAISVEDAALNQEHGKSGFFSRLYSLSLGREKYRVLAREVQVHPITDALLHIDFLRLTEDSVVNVDVPREWQNPNNELIRELVAETPNTVLADWHGYAQNTSGMHVKDGIHLSTKGVNKYAAVLEDAVVTLTEAQDEQPLPSPPADSDGQQE